MPFGDILGMNFVRSVDRRPVIFLLINVGTSDCFNALQILATFTNGSLTQLPNQIAMQRSGLREVNKRIRQAMEIRSSERMRKEHITAFTQVFKDSHMEGKVRTFRSEVEAGPSADEAQRTLISVWRFSSTPR